MPGTVPADRKDNFTARAVRLLLKIAMIAARLFGTGGRQHLKTLRARAVPGIFFLLVAARAADRIQA